MVALSGCTVVHGPPTERPCLPERLELSSSAVAPGQRFTLSAPATTCDLDYDEQLYSVSLGLMDPSGPIELATNVPVADDGGFSVEVVVPQGVRAGDAVIVVTGSAYDRCADTSSGASCASYSTNLSILPSTVTEGLLVVSTVRPEVVPLAAIEGTLALTNDGCFGLASGAAEVTLLAFPVGSTTIEGGVDIPGLGPVLLGDQLSGGGGVFPFDTPNRNLLVPPECRADSITILNPFD